MGPTVADVLAGARYTAPASSKSKTVLLIGASARLGEKLLVRLLAASCYHRVFVLADQPMPSTDAKLFPITAEQWDFPIDDVIAIVDSHKDSVKKQGSKRTDVFSSLVPDAVLPVAQQAKTCGASRFMLVTPTASWAQPAAFYAQLANLMDVQLLQIGFDVLLLVRPSDQEIRQKGTGLGQRFWGLLVTTAAGLMTGPKYAPLSLDGAARAIVLAMQEPAQNVRILETGHLQQLLVS